MSEDGQEKRPGFWRRLASAPWRWSLPARAAWSFFFFLVILVLFSWTMFFASENNLAWWHVMWWRRMALVSLLTVVLPVVLYYGLKLWLEARPARFPEIDYAWSAGLEALRKSGIDLNATPIFLILGSGEEQLERSLLKAARLPLRVDDAPEGPAPLHWYANPEGVYLFCTEASWLSQAARLSEKKIAQRQTAPGAWTAPPIAAQRPAPPAPTPPPPPAAPAPASPASARPAPSTDPVRGTISLDQFVQQEQELETESPAPAAGSIRGTIELPTQAAATKKAPSSTVSLPATPAGGLDDPNPAPLQEQPTLVPPSEAALRQTQLAYVCQLLRRQRQPICPINGVLTLLPFEIVQATPTEAEELQRAVRADLLTIQRELALRFPVTALVSGLERERGFRELVRRVGLELAAAQRFGRKYDLRCVAAAEDMRSLSAHLCGAFEDWVYTLFREQQALTRPGNLRLYGLLCKVRCNLKLRLAEILAGGFGYDPRQTPHDQPLLFSGCYFAATGPTPDRQAFVKSVFDKLLDEQENVEWTRQALVNEQRYTLLATTGWVVAAILFITLIAALFYVGAA